MNARQARLRESIHAVVACLRDRRFHTRTIAPLIAELQQLAAAIKDLSVEQELTGRMLGNDGREVASLKAALRTKHLLPICRRGKLLLKGYPGIEESLRVPHARAPVAEQISATKRILKAVRPHMAAFRAAGFPPRFVLDADAAAKALRQRADVPETVANRRSRATLSLRPAIKEARDIIAAIDSHVNAEFDPGHPAIGLWRHAKRVPARRGRPRAKKQP